MIPSPQACTALPPALPILDGRVTIDRAFLLGCAYLQPGDVAFVGGSLIEGRGNPYSDVDVHVITQRRPTGAQIDVASHFRVLDTHREILRGGEAADVFLIHTVLPGTQIKVDVEYRTVSEFENLVSRIANVYDYACSSLVLLTKTLEQREMALVHRLFHSHALTEPGGLARLRDDVGLSRYTYLLYRWKASDFSVLIDVLGALEQGETDRAFDLARENLITQFHAYIHLRGCTNFNRKWLLPSMEDVGVPADLRTAFLRLYRVEGVSTEAERRRYVLESLDFVDRVFEASAPLLEEHPLAPSGRAAVQALESSLREQADDYDRLELEYRLRAYGVARRPTRALLAEVPA